MCANSLHRSKTAIGAYFRRLKTRLGSPKAVTAAAHKLARLIYNMLKYGQQYHEKGELYYEEKYKKRVMKNLRRRAHELGFEIVPLKAN